LVVWEGKEKEKLGMKGPQMVLSDRTVDAGAVFAAHRGGFAFWLHWD
jgi:hypothetical protein